MSIYVKTLASSSSGNSTIVFTEKTKILVDAGISCKRIKESLMSLDIMLADIDAILITHAHGDHVKGLMTLLKYTKCTVFCSRRTFKALCEKPSTNAVITYASRFDYYTKAGVTVGDVHVDNYKFPHDGWLINGTDRAGDHYGFVFKSNSEGPMCRIGFVTDLGHFPEELLQQYFNCDFYVLESNHDTEKQKKSLRPMGLIKRNLSKFGHLSNDQAAGILTKLLHPQKSERKTKRVLLAHLSKECNTGELAKRVVKDRLIRIGANDVAIHIAPHEEPSQLFLVE